MVKTKTAKQFDKQQLAGMREKYGASDINAMLADNGDFEGLRKSNVRLSWLHLFISFSNIIQVKVTDDSTRAEPLPADGRVILRPSKETQSDWLVLLVR